ncbi:diacylglycerol diphosphate phosphatase / phosphatidate phosphatase [Nematocida sp. AWRm77]|nr:diacylglycerol diphosphate phosphatase / phosphatidate phosphatase [Nematocida sp. AWRm77]
MYRAKRIEIEIIVTFMLGLVFSILPPLSLISISSTMPGREYVEKDYVNYRILVFLVVVSIPLVLYAIRKPLRKTSIVEETCEAYLGLSLGNLLVNILKFIVGKERPDYDSRIQQCPDGQKYLEGRRSFPSGHSSLAVGTAVFIAYYGLCASKNIKNGAKKGLFLFGTVIVPAILAGLVCISRIADNRHDIVDVFAGAFIGTAVSMGTILYYRSSREYPHRPLDIDIR